MSENVEAAPTSTGDIAASVVESYEPEPVEASTETPEASTSETTPVPGVLAEPLSDEEALLHEFGFKHATKPDGRQHYIPRDKVLKMIASGLKRGQDKWTTDKTTLEQERNQLKADIEEWYGYIKGDDKALLSRLAEHDPRYRVYLEPPKVEPPPQALALPDPDVKLSDGSRTFSMEAFQKSIIPFIVEQAKKEAKAEAEHALKPLKEREEQQKVTAQVHERTRTMIADAQQWPGFKDHEADILKALQEDSDKAKAAGKRPTLSLEAAYRQAVIPKLAADRNKMREELLKELDTSAKASPSVTRSSAETTKPQQLTTADIARRTMEQLERGA